jgi:hypothetical protein
MLDKHLGGYVSSVIHVNLQVIWTILLSIKYQKVDLQNRKRFLIVSIQTRGTDVNVIHD